MMFKILVLQSLYNLSDGQTEYQLRDRISFMRFLGFKINESIPDEKTIWAFRERLTSAGAIDKLFARFNKFLGSKGFEAKIGQMVDAAIVSTPKRRDTREHNDRIKEGDVPHHIAEHEPRLRQKDLDAKWTKKRGQNHFGYKNHINADTKHKFVRKYAVTPASTSDPSCLEELLDSNNNKKLWADSAYRTPSNEALLEEEKYIDKMHFRVKAYKYISEPQRRENARRSKIRKRVEHVFGFVQNSMHGQFIRTIGLKRAKTKIGLMNLVYNLCRYEQVLRLDCA
jgi:IS5 family transposase